MATINPLFGRMKGKYGGSVMYSNNGKQCMRERVLEVRNPRSSKQAIQRCIMATVNQFVTAFTPVLNNAIESEYSKARNLAKIRSYNLNIVRQLAANGDGAYCPKGAQFVAPNDYLISRGTLRGMLPLRDAAARNYLANSGGLVFSVSDLQTEDVSRTASAVFPSVRVGDQITILASMTEDIAEGSLSAYCRFAFKDDVTPALTYEEGVGTILNPAAIDLTKADGDWQKLVFAFEPQGIDVDGASAILLGGLVLDASTNIQCAGVIVSREEERKRSTSYMVSKTPDEYLLNEVYPTYMDGGTSIDMPSEVYLNNDAVVVEPPFLTLLNIDNTDVILPMTKAISTSETGMFKFSGSPATRFNLYVDFSIAGTSYSAQLDQASSSTVGDVTWRYSSGNTITAEGTQSVSVTITKVRYRDNEGHDITWQ